MATSKRKSIGKTRGCAWNDAETYALLEIWNDQSIEEQLENPLVNNGSIYKSVATEMTEKGFEKTADQCKIRIHTLKRPYRECKGNLKKSGKGRKICKFFEELNDIFGNRPASSPLKVIEPLSRKRSNDESYESESSDNELVNQTETGDLSDIESLEKYLEGQKDDEAVEKKTEDEVGVTNNKKSNENKAKEKSDKKRVRKTKLEVALKSVMDGVGETTSKAEEKFLDLEKRKIDLEKQRLDIEKAKMESEERQRREERQHQFNMMKMVMDVFNQNRGGPPQSNSSSSTYNHQTPTSQGQSQWNQGCTPMSLERRDQQQFFGSGALWSPGDRDKDQSNATYFNL